MIDQPSHKKVPVDRFNDFFSLVPYEQVIYSESGKYNQDAVFAFIYDRRIYFKLSTARAKILMYVNMILIPKIDQQQDLFGSIGNQERRIVNRRENQLNDSVGYNELTSDDLQDIIDTQQD